MTLGVIAEFLSGFRKFSQAACLCDNGGSVHVHEHFHLTLLARGWGAGKDYTNKLTGLDKCIRFPTIKIGGHCRISIRVP